MAAIPEPRLSPMERRIALAVWALRLSKRLRYSRFKALRPLGAVVSRIYRAYSLTILGMDIPVSTSIGKGLKVYHGFGLVVSSFATFGSGVVLRHGTTVGATGGPGTAPRVGDMVDIGAGAILVGPIVIGDHARIGAGCVVTRDVPAHSTAVGNPMRVIEQE